MDDHGHDHSQATHTMHCRVNGCDHVMEVHAHDDEQAIDLIVVAGGKHFEEAGHPMDQSMTPEQQKEMTKKHMKKVS